MEPADYFKNIVVDATITNEPGYKLVRLYYTQSISDDSSLMVRNALVTVTSGDSTVHFIERDTLPGFYFSEVPFVGEPGKTYHLSISNVDVNEDGVMDTYEATSTMADALEMDSITYTYIPEWKATTLNCFAWDPPVRNYYNFRALVNGVMVTDTLYEFQITDDEMYNGNYTHGVVCQVLNDENTDEFVENGDTLTLQIDNIDEPYFDYIGSAIKEYYGFNPLFGGLPANVAGNITNNAIGIFRVYSVSRSSVIVNDLIREEE